jgi:hypothetical protein
MISAQRRSGRTDQDHCQAHLLTNVRYHLQADLAAWFREVHALWLGRGLYAELRVADVVQEVLSV